MISPRFMHNVVAQAEFRHQRYVINTSRSGRFWIVLALVMLIPAFIGSLVSFAHGIISPFVSFSLLPENINMGLTSIVLALLMVMSIALYAVVHLVTLALGASSITREKTGRTWETLLLTNIDAYQIVWGKWWATIRALWGDQLLVGLLRLGLLADLVQAFIGEAPALPLDFPAQPVHIVVFAVIILIYTLLDAGFSSALGVLSPLPDWNGAITASLLLALRLLATIASVVWFVWMVADFVASSHWTYILIGIGGLLLYLVGTWGVLRLAQIIAVRGQASPPASTG